MYKWQQFIQLQSIFAKYNFRCHSNSLRASSLNLRYTVLGKGTNLLGPIKTFCECGTGIIELKISELWIPLYKEIAINLG